MKQHIYIFSTILAGVLWGSMSIFLRGLNSFGFSNLQILAVKAVFTVLFQIIFILITNKQNLKIALKDLWIFVCTGILSITFFQLCYFKSILELGASTSVILLYTSPIWVLLFSAVLFKEKITKEKLLGFIMTFAGCVLITGFSNSSITTKGIMIGLCSGLGYALYSIFGRIALKKYGTSTLILYTFLLNGISVLPFANMADVAAKLNSKSLMLFLGIAVVCTALPYALYSYGLSGLEAGQAGIFVTVEPLVASLIGIFLWKEEVSVVKIAGIIAILSAVVILGSSGKKNYES